MTTTPTSGAADLLAMVSKALREAYNLGMMYWQQADSEYISQHKKADDTRAKFLALVEETCAALAAGQATAAQAVVQDDLITIRKPTTSAEMLWLLKLAHLVISDVDKTLEETFAPAQPAPEASRFGSPELQAMIIARCVEKDQADSMLEDAARWHWMAEYIVGTRTDLDDEIIASATVDELRKLVDADLATRKQGEKHDR